MSKAVKSLKKAVGSVAKGVIGAAGLGGDKQKTPTPAAPAAEVTVAPTKADEEGTNTEADRKAAKSRGKRSLSVSRSAGSGLNI
jgi:hypothetical protein